MTASTLTTSSSDRLPVLTTTKAAASRQPKLPARVGGTARRILSALMRSLAAPHV